MSPQLGGLFPHGPLGHEKAGVGSLILVVVASNAVQDPSDGLRDVLLAPPLLLLPLKLEFQPTTFLSLLAKQFRASWRASSRGCDC